MKFSVKMSVVFVMCLLILGICLSSLFFTKIPNLNVVLAVIFAVALVLLLILFLRLQKLFHAQNNLISHKEDLERMVEVRTFEIKKYMDDLKESRDVLLSALDETGRSKRELEHTLEKLRKRETQLIQAGKLAGIGELAAGVAHEINNPLTNILGYTQLLLTKDNKDPEIVSDLHNIERESKRCVSIIDSLLNFARPARPNKARIDIGEIIDATLRVVRFSITNENIELIKNFDKDLPMVMADPYQLQQVFMNIVINAVHAMPKGGVLSISAKLHDGTKDKKCADEMSLSGCNRFLCISFSDTGVGISEENRSKIFDPFFTTSYETGHKGAGLGLSISSGIVKEHGGEIEVESTINKGSTFNVLLPI